MKANKRATIKQIPQNERSMKPQVRPNLVKLAVWLTKEEDAFIFQEAKLKRGIPKQNWLAEAVREKLRVLKESGESDPGPFALLSPRDIRRVERYIELLRAAGEDEAFRDAVDANFALFDRVIQAGK